MHQQESQCTMAYILFQIGFRFVALIRPAHLWNKTRSLNESNWWGLMMLHEKQSVGMKPTKLIQIACHKMKSFELSCISTDHSNLLAAWLKASVYYKGLKLSNIVPGRFDWEWQIELVQLFRAWIKSVWTLVPKMGLWNDSAIFPSTSN